MSPIERKVSWPIMRTRSRHRIGHGEKLITLLIKQQMVIPKVRATHVPVEVLGLEAERERIGEQPVEGGSHVASTALAQHRARAESFVNEGALWRKGVLRRG